MERSHQGPIELVADITEGQAADRAVAIERDGGSAVSVRVLKSAGMLRHSRPDRSANSSHPPAGRTRSLPAVLVHTGVGMSVKVPKPTVLLPRPALVANALTFKCRCWAGSGPMSAKVGGDERLGR